MTKPLRDIANPEARLDELEYRLENGPWEAAVEAALQSLTDPFPPIRHRATSALAVRVDPTLANLFGGIVLENEEAMGRAMAELDFEVPELEPSGMLRQAACRILAHTRGEGTESVLQQAASDPDPDVRYQALVALHQVEPDEEDLERVVGARLQDSDPEVATVAAQITAQQGWTQFTDALEAIWRRATGKTGLQFAISLAELVGEHGGELDEETIEELVDVLTDALGDERTIAGAARALVSLGADRATEPLRGVLNRWFVHPILRVEAAGALIELGDDSGRDFLEDAFDDKRKDVRGYALRTAGRLGMSEHFDRLATLARSEDYHADTAVIALAEWGSDEALEVLEDVSESHPDEDLRRLANSALLQRRELGRFEPEMFEFL